LPVSATEIERELRHIGNYLTTKRTAVSFGGCSMSIQNYKDSTRDTDLIVLPPNNLHELLLDLARAHYHPVPKDLDEIVADHAHLDPGWPLDEWLIVERSDGLRIDLFPPDNVFGGLQFTKSMLSRTSAWIDEGNLSVRLADASIMFMLKSITGRWHHTPDLPMDQQRDLEDLPSLLSRNEVDWQFIHDEWELQRPHLKASHITNAAEAVAYLRKTGFAVPWQPSL
jgi:hypothetical protein